MQGYLFTLNLSIWTAACSLWLHLEPMRAWRPVSDVYRVMGVLGSTFFHISCTNMSEGWVVRCQDTPVNFCLLCCFSHVNSVSFKSLISNKLFPLNIVSAETSLERKITLPKIPFLHIYCYYWQWLDRVQAFYFCLPPIRVGGNCNISHLTPRCNLSVCNITEPVGTRSSARIMLIIEITLNRVVLHNSKKSVKKRITGYSHSFLCKVKDKKKLFDAEQINHIYLSCTDIDLCSQALIFHN